MLSDLVSEYHSLMQQIRDLESQKKELKEQIRIALEQQGDTLYEDEAYKASITRSERVSYNHEELTEFLYSKGLTLNEFSKPTVDPKRLEALIVEGHLTIEEVISYAKITPITTLSVKEK